MLVVDATQGVEAQTLANTYLAMEHDLEILPVFNKIDLPAADPDEGQAGGGGHHRPAGHGRPGDLRQAGDQHSRRCWRISCRIFPPPAATPSAPLQALIFDSQYDPYRGRDRVLPGDGGRPSATGQTDPHDGHRRRVYHVLECGYLKPLGNGAYRCPAGRRGGLLHRQHQKRQGHAGGRHHHRSG